MPDTNEDYSGLMIRYHKGDKKEKMKIAEQLIDKLDLFIYEVMKSEFTDYVAKYKDDLYQEGVIGILKNIQQFNPDNGKLTTFFYVHIKHAMIEFISNVVHKTTTHYNSRIIAIKKAIEQLKKNNKDVTDISIAIESNMSEKTVIKILDIMNNLNSCSLDEDSYEDVNISKEYSNPEQIIMQKEEKQAIHKAIAKLNKLEQDILDMKFGFTKEPLTYKEISEKLNITKYEVKKALQHALAVIKYNSNLNKVLNGYINKSDLFDLLEPEVDIEGSANQIQSLEDMEELEIGIGDEDLFGEELII